jgi:catechol 2,3-dioxygenase-like lactoylglutathione lyase family enzyme
MPNVSGVLETALYVEDVQRSIRFYQTLFKSETLFADDRLCAMSVAGRQVLLLFKKGATIHPIATPEGNIPPHDGSGNLHLAFSISAEDLEPWEKWLQENGVTIESKVKWDRGGYSLYFRDPDGHLIELVTPGCWAIY